MDVYYYFDSGVSTTDYFVGAYKVNRSWSTSNLNWNSVSGVANQGIDTTVLEQEYLAEGTQLKVRLDANQLGEFEKYLSKGE